MRNPFPPTSRYQGLELAEFELSEGRSVAFLRRRFLPPTSRFSLVQEHVVAQGERLDQVTAHFLGDAEQFWRICDANGVMRPNELEVFGRRVRITMPEGMVLPEATDA
jgi:hypothetical protein